MKETYSYDAFGSQYGDNSFGSSYGNGWTTGVVNEYGYNGKRFDSAVGLADYGFRDYAPQVGRFTTVDPIKSGLNWYVYVGNDPVNKIDLWGLLESDSEAVPQTPPGVDIDENILQSEFLPTALWVNNVREDGDWDYKSLDLESYEDFGNFNYGATGRAQGFSEETLLRAAGFVQMLTGPYDPEENNTPWSESPYGDQRSDQEMIKKGSEYYEDNIDRINDESDVPIMTYPPSSWPQDY